MHSIHIFPFGINFVTILISLIHSIRWPSLLILAGWKSFHLVGALWDQRSDMITELSDSFLYTHTKKPRKWMCCTIQRNQRMLCVASKILLFFHGNISSFECAFYWEQYPMSRFRLCLFCQFLMFMLVGLWPFTVLPPHRTVWETESNGPCMLFVRFKRGDIRNLRLKWLNSPTPGAFQLNRHLPHTNYTKRPGLGNPRKREREWKRMEKRVRQALFGW